MMNIPKYFCTLALVFVTLALSPAHANDSSAAIGLGGLELKQSNAISMDSEELFLSMERVTVKYQFTNTTDKDVRTLVSFPLPEIPGGIDGHMGDRGLPDWKELDFKTLVDGEAVALSYRNVITANGKNVEHRLKELAWPVQYWLDYKFQDRIADLPEKQRKQFIAEGLIEQPEGWSRAQPAWSVSTHVTREQLFPAGKTITVEHSYKPIAGGTNGGNMSPTARQKPNYGFDWFKKTYCIDDEFIAGFDKTYNTRGEGKREQYVESFLDYRLSPGANWKGPIKKFRLVIDKGASANLVSLCMDGVKKTSPTQFEVTKTNFTPDKDLKVLIVRWFNFP